MGRTLVESVQSDSDVIRFVAGATRTVSPEVTAFAEAQKLQLADRLRGAARRSGRRRGGPGDAALAAREQVIAAAQAGKHVFCEKPFALTKAEADAAVAATRKAGVTLGLGYNRRFHPEMTTLRDRIKAGDLGTVLHVEATMTFPERADAEAGRLARAPGRDAVRRPDADGRARHRRHDRSLRRRSTRCSARASGASWRWTATTRRRCCSG